METTARNSVLIVDDEKSNIIALTYILCAEYNTYAAKNGKDAIDIAKEFSPDVILLDILMPEMDGYKTLSLLKNIEETRTIPIIFITGLAKDEDEEKGMALGAADYITKPFSQEIVRLRVRNQIQITNQIKMIKQSSIVENSPQFIMYLSPDGGISYANPAVSLLTGRSNAEIMAGGLELIFEEETARAIKNKYIPNTLQKGADSFEINMICKGAKIRILAFTSFTAEKGNIGVIAQDVTEMRALEAELITAKERAEQSSHAKIEFLSRMSHEMRTPMNVIIGMANIAKISPERKAECLEEIDSASRHLLELIDDVLEISSLKKNTSPLEYSEFSFGTMLNKVLKTIQQYTDKKHQTLSLNIDPLIPDALIGDERHLALVIRKLLMNASKFTHGGGKIQLDAGVFSEEGETVLLKVEVTDNGIGIPKEKQASIFLSFEQADGSLSRKFEGAGLGLTISKYLVEMMGGKIWVESEPDKGAKFIFTFKVKSLQGGKLAYNDIDEHNINFSGKKALLVEDVEINRDIIMTMLEGTQLQIDCAENGMQAIEMFTASPNKYGIILMDINMPGMDGWEAASRIRAMDTPEGKSVKIVAMTANTFQEDIKRSREAGMDDHIGKPVDFNDLLHKLNKYLT